MKIPHNNLVFVAYKTGYCGSLVNAIISLSKEVQQYKNYDKNLEFADSTAHEALELWLPELHNYNQSLKFSKHKWEEGIYTTEKLKKALESPELICVRTHPNIVYNLSFVKNLKVVYVSSDNPYKYERWAYEKTIKPTGDDWYISAYQSLFQKNKIIKTTQRNKRNLLIRNINHDVKSYGDCAAVLDIMPFNLNIDSFLNADVKLYTSLCDYLKISPIEISTFQKIIQLYKNKQWKRFF